MELRSTLRGHDMLRVISIVNVGADTDSRRVVITRGMESAVAGSAHAVGRTRPIGGRWPRAAELPKCAAVEVRVY